MELVLHVPLKPTIAVLDDLVLLAFHLDVLSELADKDNMVIADLQTKIWRYKKRFLNVSLLTEFSLRRLITLYRLARGFSRSGAKFDISI